MFCHQKTNPLFHRTSQRALLLIQVFALGALFGCGVEDQALDPAEALLSQETKAVKERGANEPSQPEDGTPETLIETKAQMLLSAVKCSLFTGRCTGIFCFGGSESTATGKRDEHSVKGCAVYARLEECEDGTVRKGSGTCIW